MIAEGAKILIRDVAAIPSAESGLFRVWQRNFYYFKKAFWLTLFFMVLEPLLYLVALGYGLGYFIGHIDGAPYLNYFLPALVAITATMVSFFESSYGAFSRYKSLSSYGSLLMSPVSGEEIVLGEILWGATKGFVTVLGLAAVALTMGLVKTWLILPALLILALCCWIFSALGMLLTSYARSTDIFIYMQTVLVLPLSLLSNTYFPVESISKTLSYVSWAFPLSHVTHIVRSSFLEVWPPNFITGLAVLILYAVLLTNWAVARMKRKIFN